MSEIPQDLLYTEDHEYLKPAGEPGVMYIGVTDYAQGELGDIVFVELPKVGATFRKHDVFGTIEAVKAVSELYAPVGGTVLEVNQRLDDQAAALRRVGEVRADGRRGVQGEGRIRRLPERMSSCATERSEEASGPSVPPGEHAPAQG